MYSTCLYCTRDLDKNEVLETLPIGRRVAFDAHKGRLWVVCRKCAKWNLVPFDTRLETIDDCERLYRDTAKRFATDNIGIAKVREGLELVRIGEPMRPEFAAWRYGESYKKRRRKSIAIGVVGGAATLGLAAAGLATAGLSVGGVAGFGWMISSAGGSKLINHGARFKVKDPRPHFLSSLAFNHAQMKRSTITWADGEAVLDMPAYSSEATLGSIRWSGTSFHSVGRKVTGGLNLTVGLQRHLDSASELLAYNKGDLNQWLANNAKERFFGPKSAEYKLMAESPERSYIREYDQPFMLLGEMTPTERLAVEMWMNEDVERIYLEGELKLLEREWREAEELAGIADKLAIDGTQDTDDS